MSSKTKTAAESVLKNCDRENADAEAKSALERAPLSLGRGE